MRLGISIAFTLLAGQSLLAQQAVQQPVIGASAVNTSVSVSDRGSTFVGGVSSAQSGRSQYGPLRSGTSSGYARHSTSISAKVDIIDLHEMDQALLNSSPVAPEKARSVVNRPVTPRIAKAEHVASDSSAQKAATFEKLAREAEKAGKIGVAKVYWQAAGKYGSKAAEKRLAELMQPSSLPSGQVASRSSH